MHITPRLCLLIPLSPDTEQLPEMMGLMLTCFAHRKPTDKPLPHTGRQVHLVPINGHPTGKNFFSLLIHLRIHRKSSPGGFRIPTASLLALGFGMRFYQRGIYGQALWALNPAR
jgi:hypothetical protein